MFEFLHLPFIASGFAVGFIVGLTGVGGGSLMTPVLIFLFGVHPGTAVGTDLLYASGTKLAGTAVHNLHRNVDWPLVGRLALGSLPAAGFSLLALWHLGAGTANALITHSLGVALAATAIAILLRRQILRRYGGRAAGLETRTVHALTVAAGAVLGALVTLSSVGAGALGVTALLLLYPRHDVARIVGSDIAHAVPLTLIAGAGHLAMGQTDLSMLASLLLGSVPGIMLASSIAPRLPEQVLRYGLAAVLLLVSLRLLA
ncbi:MAG: hypothetical protein BGN85_02025 [Alphaproteobacteria bacterium 64-11]|nr:sulfite exporter TauE/SafE family protein [Alphaproteobacteria bacterium]OJU12672.1 MAG: hypothetical protein BGN85_02025 [Alphaproteobacteria bacterium 64-11]